MPNPDEALEEAWRENHDRWPSQSVVESSWRRAGFRDGWDARGQHDDQRIAELVEGVRALHNGHGGAYGGVFCYSACHALAALEEAGSA